MQKTESIHIACTPDERRAIEAIARHDRRKLSEAMREVIREAAQQRGLWPLERAKEVGDHAAP